MEKISYKQLSVFFYGISLATPTFIGAWLFMGFMCLGLGWIGVLQFDPIIGLPWLANVFYLLIFIFNKKDVVKRIIFSILCICLGLFAIGIRTLPRDEGGGNYEVFVGFGFLFWMLSFVIMLLGQIKEYRNT